LYKSLSSLSGKINKIMTNSNNDSAGIYRTGDIVIGSTDPGKSVYSATGAKIIKTGVTIFGSEADLQSQVKEISKSAMRSGGIPIPLNPYSGGKQTKPTKKRNQKQQKWVNYDQDTHQQPLFSEPVKSTPIELPLETIQFENSFGKIKAKVETLIEHDMAFMLVFRNEEDVVFEPKVGEQLSFYTPNKYRYDVYYPGVTFDWPDATKKFMILFKIPEETQE
jgi:hypothetical protein